MNEDSQFSINVTTMISQEGTHNTQKNSPLHTLLISTVHNHNPIYRYAEHLRCQTCGSWYDLHCLSMTSTASKIQPELVLTQLPGFQQI